ncbi:MAG TPA: ABC transporter substrate-binding protein [Rectinemataceae bacterium]|nr:ABC transporter substrate-binding protein [Rectinemataceae bacterium]
MKKLLAVFALATIVLGAAMAADTTITVLGTWGGQEADTFQAMTDAFTAKTGIKVQFEATRDLDAVLTTRVQAGNPPDIAVLPNPGKLYELAKAGKLVDLSKVLDMKAYAKNYSQGWKDLGSVDGKLYGLFVKAAIKGLVWYDPKNVKAAGITLPSTWDQMIATSKQIAATGVTPWSVGIESGAASGWVATDWLENIFLRLYGPAKYQDWYNGKLAWTSPEMKKAWQYFGQIVGDPTMAYGGSQYINSTNFGNAPAPLFQNPPKAYFHMQASFIQSFIMDQFPGLKPAVDFDFFGFPSIDPKWAKAVEGGADIVAVFKNNPAVRQFMEYFASAEAQSYFAAGTGALATNKNVSLVFYPDPLTKRAADLLNKSEIVVFDASDMMPSEMNASFWKATVDFVNDPSKLDSILAGLDKVRATAYKK